MASQAGQAGVMTVGGDPFTAKYARELMIEFIAKLVALLFVPAPSSSVYRADGQW
jgi:hypothetical protein